MVPTTPDRFHEVERARATGPRITHAHARFHRFGDGGHEGPRLVFAPVDGVPIAGGDFSPSLPPLCLPLARSQDGRTGSLGESRLGRILERHDAGFAR
jgi:hypothetical protein